MIIMYGSVIIFNIVMIKKVKKFSGNMILQIWLFTCTFQQIFDIFITVKYQGYWYISKAIDWSALPGYSLLVPPVNLLFLNWFPFNSSHMKRIMYFVKWEILFLSYELISLLPEPWGFLHYGWWRLWHSALINPILVIFLIGFYKFASKLENKVRMKVT